MKIWNLAMLLLSGMFLVYGLGLVSLFTLGIFSNINQFFITIGMVAIPVLPFFLWLYMLYRFHVKKDHQNLYIGIVCIVLFLFALIYDIQMAHRYVA